MGRKRATLNAYASLSNHNDDQDERDEAAWLKFTAAVRDLAEQPEYADLDIMIDADPSE